MISYLQVILFFLQFLVYFCENHNLISDLSHRFTQQNSQSSNIDTSTWPIFKPYPIYTTNNLNYCQYYLNSDVFYFNANNQDYIAVSLKDCGFNIFSLDDPLNPLVETHYQYQNGGQTTKFSFDQLRNLLYIATSKGEIYSINVQKKPFEVVLSFKTYNSLKAYLVNLVLGVDDIILITCFNEIQIFYSQNNNQPYYWLDLKTFSYYQSLSLNNGNDIIKIMLINNLLLVGSIPQSLQIYSISNQQSKDMTLTLLSTFKPVPQNLQDFLITSKNILYIQMQYGGVFSYDIKDCIKNVDLNSCSNFVLIERKSHSSKAGPMYITKDEKYLITQFSSIGLKIFDITQIVLKTFQIITINGDAISLAVNSAESLVFYVGTQKLQVFKREKTNIQIDEPNILLNIIQSSDTLFYKPVSPASPDIACRFDSQRNLVYLARNKLGILVLQKQPQGILKVLTSLEQSDSTQTVNKFKFFNDFTLMYVTKGAKGLSIIDFVDPANPIYVQNSITFGVQVPSFYFIDCTYDETMCFITSRYVGLLLIDITDKKNPQLLSTFSTKDINISLAFTMSSFMRYQKYLLTTVQSYGIALIDIKDPTKPQFVSSLFTNEASGGMQFPYIFFNFNFLNNNYFLLSKQRITSDDKYFIFSSNYKGVIIVDLSNLQELKIVSTVFLFGGFIQGYFMSNEKYIVIPSIENPAIFLIDIQDKLNPKLLQTVKRKASGNLLDVCIGKDENDGFIASDKPLISVNFKNQVLFHTILYQLVPVLGSNQKKFIDIPNEKPLLVGQQVNMYIFPVYANNPVSIKNVFLYENFILQPLKSWMVFSPQENTLQLKILKDSLSQDEKGNYVETSQQIIFQAHLTLDTSSFINTFLGIDLNLSTAILNECVLQGYVDDVNMVSQTFTPSIFLNINIDKIADPTFVASLTSEKRNDIITAIKYVLQHNIIYYPIEIKVSPSLSFDQKDPNQNFIQSTVNQVIIYIRASDSAFGKFVIKNYSGVLSVFSQIQDEIKIEGDVMKVNQALSQKIKFYSIASKEKITFNIQVSDGINYDITQQISYNDCQFISEQEKIKVKENTSLNQDFALNIEGSSIYIRERFQYQIPSDLFIGEHFAQLFYSAKIKQSNGDYNEIPLNHWLQFSSNDRIFSGIPSDQDLYETLYLQVQVTDNYTTITQDLTINVGKVPALFIVQICAQIIGPLIGIIGIYKYKYQVYNMTQKKYYTYSKETAIAGESYSKQILLNHSNLIAANKILEYFIFIIPGKEIKQQIYQFYSSSIKIIKADEAEPDIEKMLRLNSDENPLNDDILNSINLQSQGKTSNRDEIIENPTSDIGNQSQKTLKNQRLLNSQRLFQPSQLLDNLKTKCEDIQQQEKQEKQENISQQTPEPLLLSMNSPLGYSPRRSTITESSKFFRNQSTKQKQFNKQLAIQLQKVSQIDKSIQKSEKVLEKLQKEEGDLKIFSQDGNINYDGIIEFLIQKNKSEIIEENMLSIDLIKQLSVKSSIVRQTFESFLAEYILQQDSFSYFLLQQLQKKAQAHSINPDWYKLYCQITPNLEDIHYNPVPLIIFDDSKILQDINLLLFDQKEIKIEARQIERIPLSLKLLKEVIKAFALGFISKQAKFKPSSTGESIYIESYKIKQITSQSQRDPDLQLSKRKNKFQQLKEYYSRRFVDKPLADNSKLPPWIKAVEIINNNLLIIGHPEKKDIGTVYLYVYSKQNCILRAFEIEVIDSNFKNNKISSQKQYLNQFKLEDSNRYGLFHKDCSNEFLKSGQMNQVTNQNQQTTENQYQLDSIFEEIKKPHNNQYTL